MFLMLGFIQATRGHPGITDYGQAYYMMATGLLKSQGVVNIKD